MDLTQFSPGSALITVILLALAPFVAVMVTSFTKIVVTLSLLRNALGLQQVPPNIVLNGLALILTLYVMYPVGQQMAAANQGVKPVAAVSSDTQALFTYADKAKEPLREFLIKHSTPRINGPEKARALTQRDFIVVVPAFTVSELAAAFQIGFLIFLPFLIIDLVVSNILLAMGMMMLSPTTVSLPFKLLLFVLIDGWVKLSHGLVLSYT
jgi:type III secretion protein R